jgi:DNA replication protein DnaC
MQLFTIITTNLTPAEIREKYGDRIADRMNEMMVKIIFNNPTYRT